VLNRAAQVRTPASTAALAMSVSALGFAVMASITKLAAAEVPGAEIALVRFVCGSLFCLAWHLRSPLHPRNRKVLALRGVLGGGAVLCFFVSIEHLHVGISTLLQYTAPAFTAVWAAIFLRERIALSTILALGLTLGGVGLLVLGQSPAGATTLLDRWELVGVLGAIFSGGAVAAIRELRATEPSVTIFTAFNLGGVLVTVGPALRHWVWPSAHGGLLLLAVAAISIASQLGMTWSLRWLQAAVGGLLMQLTPVAALAIGALLFGELIHPLAWLGAAVTLAGVSLGAWLSKSQTSGPADPEDA
jgi:drug/metabolite transporter (DMT)-like permease